MGGSELSHWLFEFIGALFVKVTIGVVSNVDILLPFAAQRSTALCERFYALWNECTVGQPLIWEAWAPTRSYGVVHAKKNEKNVAKIPPGTRPFPPPPLLWMLIGRR